MARIILTNKANGSTTYLEADAVDAFFLAGALRADYTIEDEVTDLPEASPEPEAAEPVAAEPVAKPRAKKKAAK